MTEQNEIPFQEIIKALLDDSMILPPRYLYSLSDVEGKNLLYLEASWENISQPRRQALMEDLESLTERDYLLSYEAISRVAFRDVDPSVRLMAVRILWEFDRPDLIPIFLESCTQDPDEDVRAVVTTALGRFVYLGELDKLPRDVQRQIEDQLIEIVSGQDEQLVRRKALESLGYSRRGEVSALIEEASLSRDESWQASTLVAMGRSLDKRWMTYVLDRLFHEVPTIRQEAARALGEMEAAMAAPRLLELLDDPDSQVRAAAIWSLSQVGGQGVRQALQDLLDKTEDGEEADFLEIALDNLSFTEEFDSLTLFEFSESALDSSATEESDEDFMV